MVAAHQVQSLKLRKVKKDFKDVANKIEKALDFNKRTTGRNDIHYLELSVIAKEIIKIYNNILKI
mgnify:CR=1 FL=1